VVMDPGLRRDDDVETISDIRYKSTIPQRGSRSSCCLCEPPSTMRGRRECRVPVAPMASCASKKHTSSKPGVHRIARHSLRNGFNGLFRALLGDEFVLPPSSANERSAKARLGSQDLRQLDTSNGCQDHTALPSASAPFVSMRSIAHGKPALRSPCMPDAAASTASRTQRP